MKSVREAELKVIEAASNHVCHVAPWFRLDRCAICKAVNALEKAKTGETVEPEAPDLKAENEKLRAELTVRRITCERLEAGMADANLQVNELKKQLEFMPALKECSSAHQRRADAAELRYQEAVDTIERARTYSKLDSDGCPLCIYADGVFVSPCAYHREIEQMNRLNIVLGEVATAAADLQANSSEGHGWKEKSEALNASLKKLATIDVVNPVGDIPPAVAKPSQCGEWTEFGQCVAEKPCKVHAKKRSCSCPKSEPEDHLPGCPVRE